MAKGSLRKSLVVGCALAGLMAAEPAVAQQRNFNVPAQDARQSLPQFARQAGIQISAPTGRLRGVRTAALSGNLDVRAALRRLIQGTGLLIASDDGAMIVLRYGGGTGGPSAPLQGTAEPVRAPQPDRSDPSAENSSDDIVVTGTIIRNPNLLASSPVAVVGAEEIELQQASNAEELLRELPGNVPSIGSAVNNGNVGASFVNLRNLGAERNIVLLDGYRIAPSDFVGRVDLNNIPLALIQRVEVLTGGASTAYGADAVGGVVNFITRRDFEGLELSTGAQISERGDAGRQRVDLSWGANFADGRGNIVLSAGYQNSDGVRQGDRDFSAVSITSTTGFPGGSPNSVPASFSFAGGAGPVGTPGRLIGQRQVDPALGGAVRPTGVPGIYNFFNFNPYNAFRTPYERYNVYGQGSYEFSDAVELFGRGMYSRNIVDTVIAPSALFTLPVVIPVSNPFLPTALRAQFCANNDFQHGAAAFSGAAAGAVGSLATPGIQTLTPAQCAAAALATNPNDPNYRTFVTNINRRTTEIGERVSEFLTEIFDVQLGLRGDVTDAISYELVGAYGESLNTLTQDSFSLESRARQSFLSTSPTACLNGANGCVPINFFGPEGSITPEGVAFLTAPSTTTNFTSLGQVRATVNADTGIASPWAEDRVNVAIGAEYREYLARQRPDSLSLSGDLGGLDPATNIDGAFNVREVYGELIAPLVENRPFFQSLTLEAGVRYSKYNIETAANPQFDTWTWKVGGRWEPGAGLTFRTLYSRAVRAPNIGELFLPVTANIGELIIDPCQEAAPTLNSELRAICLAQGAPEAAIGNITPPGGGVINVTQGGNTELFAETADTFTVGFIFQPDFVPGLSLALDWFDIKIRDAISSPTIPDAIAACFGTTPGSPPAGASLTPACTQIRRDPTTGGLDGDGNVGPGIPLALTNLGRLETRGIDLSANYTRDLGFANLALSFVGTYTKDSLFQASPTSPNRECVGYYSVACQSIQPKFQFSQRTTLGFGPVDISLLWRYLDAVQYDPVQQALDEEVADFFGCPDPLGEDPFGCITQPEFRRIRAYHYFDLSVRFRVTNAFSLTFIVENLTDQQPPEVGTGIGSTLYNSGNTYPSSYDAIGRRFGASARFRF